MSATAQALTGSLAFELKTEKGTIASPIEPVALRFDRLGRIAVHFVGFVPAPAGRPNTVWAVNLDKDDAALSCGKAPVKAFLIDIAPQRDPGESAPQSDVTRVMLYGLDAPLARAPDPQHLPPTCFTAAYLRR